MKATEMSCGLTITDGSFNKFHSGQSAFLDLVYVKTDNWDIVYENGLEQSPTFIELFDDEKRPDPFRIGLPHTPDGTYDVFKVKVKIY
jgi:hypothetical protein